MPLSSSPPALAPDLPALRRGDPDALSRAYHAYGGMVLAVARRLTGSAADAEDVLHDVFLALPESLASYEERGRFDAWLRRLGVRTALMHLRRGRRRAEVPLAEVASPASAESAAAARLDLSAAIERLPQALRAVLVLKMVEGYSHDEIAELLEIRRGASEMRLTRAIRQLRPYLEGTR